MVTLCLSTVLPASVSGQLPPLGAARSTITEPGFMAFTISSVIEHRRRAPRDQRGGDDDVGRGDALGHLDLLPVEPALRHRPRIAADALGGSFSSGVS
jgi:hypothetical protein